MTDNTPLITDEEISAINQAHEDVVNAKSTLTYAIKAGELLEKAKDEIKETGGDWEAWLKEYCPKIAISTDRLYRKFFKEQDKLKELAGANALAVLGIRQARELLEGDETKKRKAKTKEKTKEKKAKDKKRTEAALRAFEAKGSADLATLIEGDPSPEILVKAMKDAGMESEALQEVVRIINPEDPVVDWWEGAETDDVVEALRTANWDAEDLDDLAQQLMDMAVNKRKDTPPPPKQQDEKKSKSKQN